MGRPLPCRAIHRVAAGDSACGLLGIPAGGGTPPPYGTVTPHSSLITHHSSLFFFRCVLCDSLLIARHAHGRRVPALKAVWLVTSNSGPSCAGPYAGSRLRYRRSNSAATKAGEARLRHYGLMAAGPQDGRPMGRPLPCRAIHRVAAGDSACGLLGIPAGGGTPPPYSTVTPQQSSLITHHSSLFFFRCVLCDSWLIARHAHGRRVPARKAV